jgi:hypothetical protein
MLGTIIVILILAAVVFLIYHAWHTGKKDL